MDLGLAGKVALVTGSARGMGRATALCLASEGADVVINDLHNTERGEQVADEIRGLGRQATNVKADVGDQAAVESMFERVASQFGRLDILVNNAGIGGDSSLMQASGDEWNEMLRVNLTGPFFCSKAAVPLLRQAPAGRIISIASEAAYLGETSPHYAASKAGVIALTKAMARELAQFGITVNAIAPGPTQTEILNYLPPEVLDMFRQQTPLRKLAQPTDIANLITFLASERAGHITGQVIIVDGGRIIQRECVCNVHAVAVEPCSRKVNPEHAADAPKAVALARVACGHRPCGS
jgi:3-oxoacyl-[acyl-carrier protein] reductase